MSRDCPVDTEARCPGGRIPNADHRGRRSPERPFELLEEQPSETLATVGERASQRVGRVLENVEIMVDERRNRGQDELTAADDAMGEPSKQRVPERGGIRIGA